MGTWIHDSRASRTLLDGVPMPAGAHSSRLDGRADDGAPLGTGIYFYRIRSAEGARLGRFVVTR